MFNNRVQGFIDDLIVHDHSADDEGGDTLLARLVQIAQTLTVGSGVTQSSISVAGTVSAGVLLNAPLIQSVAISVSGLSGVKNDYGFGSAAWGTNSVWLITPSGLLTLNGLDSSPGGTTFGPVFMSLFNADSANSILLKHLAGGSLAANRIICPGATDYTLGPMSGVLLFRDTSAARWRVRDTGSGSSAVTQGARTNLGLTAGQTLDITVTWPTAFADTNYSTGINVGYSDATSRAAPTWYHRVEAKTAAHIVVRATNSAAVSEQIYIEAVGIHD